MIAPEAEHLGPRALREDDLERREQLQPEAGPPRQTLSSALLRHWFLVAIPVVVLGAGAVAMGLLRTPSHTAETRLVVGELGRTGPTGLVGFTEITRSLAETYSRTVRSDELVRTVSRKLDLPQSEVRAGIAAAPVPETPMFKITGESSSSRKAIALSVTASQTLVNDVERSGGSTGERLLERYRAAETKSDELRDRVDSLQGTGGARLTAARSELAAANARADSLRQAYVATGSGGQQGIASVQIVERAHSARSDRNSVLQLLLFEAVVVGLIVGAVLAVIRERRRLSEQDQDLSRQAV